jgi:DNA polymerase V
MFALVDANAFYCSAERVFDTSLRGKPLIVASNNDGAAIARSDEAKALGVKMGQPVHELKDLVRKHGLIIRSANFTLYGDLSSRIVSILRDAAPRVEVYSIDEQFCDLSPVRDRFGFALEMRDRIRRWVGIPCCVGIGPTKTLAKASNRTAKRGAGVVDLTDMDRREEVLASFPAEDLWGVGRRWSTKLATMGITTAAQLRDAPTALILERFGVVLTRTQRELQGHSCIALEEIEPDRKQIVVSRSFGERVEDHAAVGQALATFAIRAAEKLRSRNLVASGIWVFANTDVFRPELRQHHPSISLNLPAATSDTRIILDVVRRLQVQMLRSGYAYKRAGVALLDLARPQDLHGDLFQSPTVGNEALMTTLDRINRRFGRGTAGFAASGWQPSPAWGMRQRMLSPCYTTRVADFPKASC